MKYIAALDYDHLDNGIFLKSVGRALTKQQGVRSIIVHGESEYTERLIQTGIMREEARIRCIRGLNHRLVALLADEGVATIGLNGYQRDLITLKDDTLTIDLSYFQKLPSEPVLLLSTLVLNAQTGKPEPVSLIRYIEFLTRELSAEEVFLFSSAEDQAVSTDGSIGMDVIPEDLKNLAVSARITTTSGFGKLPDLEGSTRIEELKK